MHAVTVKGECKIRWYCRRREEEALSNQHVCSARLQGSLGELSLAGILLTSTPCVCNWLRVQFIQQFFPTKTAPKEVHAMTDEEIDQTLRQQFEVGAPDEKAQIFSRSPLFMFKVRVVVIEVMRVVDA